MGGGGGGWWVVNSNKDVTNSYSQVTEWLQNGNRVVTISGVTKRLQSGYKLVTKSYKAVTE